MVGLTRTSDGLVYGTAFQNVPGGSTSLTHVFRFSPPSGALEVVAEPGVNPSQLVEAGDGHLYGVTEHIPRIFRVRRQPGGAHTVETVHDATAADGLVAAREALAVGLDGFLYGTALLEGVHRVGTVFRVDPWRRPSSRSSPSSPPELAHLEAVGPGARREWRSLRDDQPRRRPRCGAPCTASTEPPVR